MYLFMERSSLGAEKAKREKEEDGDSKDCSINREKQG